MGMYVNNAIIATAERAVELKHTDLFSAAGSTHARRYSKPDANARDCCVSNVKEANLPYIVVLTHPTTGGVTASYAMLGDVQIAEPNALICLQVHVIEQTIRETLPEGFQRAEYLLDHGMLDRVTPRIELREKLITIVRMLMKKSLRSR